MKVELNVKGPLDPSEWKLKFVSQYGHPVRYYDDGDGHLWIMRDTMGIQGIVRCRHEHTAYEIVGDEFRMPLPDEDVHEAYGSFDKLLKFMESRGHENDYALRHFCSRYDVVWFAICSRRLQAGDDCLELIEGYEYQSNATGSGIVSVDLNGELLEPLTSAEIERLELVMTIEDDNG